MNSFSDVSYFSFGLFLLLFIVCMILICRDYTRRMIKKSLSENSIYDRNYVSSMQGIAETAIQDMKKSVSRASDVIGSSSNAKSQYDAIESFYKQFEDCYYRLKYISDSVFDIRVEARSVGEFDLLCIERLLQKYNKKLNLNLTIQYDEALMGFLGIHSEIIAENRRSIESYRSEFTRIGINLARENLIAENRSKFSSFAHGALAIGSLLFGALDSYYEKQRMYSESSRKMVDAMNEDINRALDGYKSIHKAIELLMCLSNYHSVYCQAVKALNRLEKQNSGADQMLPVLEKLAYSYSNATNAIVKHESEKE